MKKFLQILVPGLLYAWNKVPDKNLFTRIWLALMVAGSSVIIAFAAKTMVLMVTIANTLFF